jgi:pSer/pThr/pTyr-binding forkhead associated (FHA) protein
MNPSEAKLFLASCGASGPVRVLAAAGGVPPREHLFDRPFLIAGRDPRSCVRLEGPAVSRRHAYFQVVEGRLLCVDLGSRTGLVWPAGDAAGSGWVTSEGVRVGPWSLLPAGDGAPAEPVPNGPEGNPLTDRATRPGWPEATVEVTGGSRPGSVRCRLSRMVALVGTAAPCQLRLHHPSVSRFHCSLVWTPFGVWLVDLLSREGTRLNGRPTTWARVSEGDEVEVGDYRLRFHYAAEAAGPTALLRSGPAGGRPSGPDLAVSLPALPQSTGTLLSGDATGLAGLHAPALRPGPEANLLLPLVQQFNLMQRDLCEQFHQTTLMMFRMFTAMHQEQAGLVREEMQHIQRITGELQALQQQLRDRAAPPLRPEAPPGAAAGAGIRPVGARGPASPPPAAPAPAAPAPAAPGQPAVSPGEMDAWLNQRIDELQTERRTRWQSVLGFLSGQ